MSALESTEKPYLEELDESVYSVAEPLAIVEVLAIQGIGDRIALEGTGIRRSAQEACQEKSFDKKRGSKRV